MHIALVSRHNEKSKWGGDLKALQMIRNGFELLGHTAHIAATVAERCVSEADLIFLGSACFDLRPSYHLLQLMGKKYGVIPFYEDFHKSWFVANEYYSHIQNAMKESRGSIPFVPKHPLGQPYKTINKEVLEEALVCIANSPTEKAVLERDCPNSKTALVYWSHKFFAKEKNKRSFLAWTGLKKGEYLIQVGRIARRKNQLATILASKDLPMPLVFVAVAGGLNDMDYLQTCLEAILRYRKAPTILISQSLPEMKIGNLQVLTMPEDQILPEEMVIDAMENAGLHVHPAFCELPGYTYIESIYLGTPTIASSWTTIQEYLTDPLSGKYLLDSRIIYCLPYDIEGIKHLIEKKFGQRFSSPPALPTLERSELQIATEILRSVEHHL